MYERLSVKREKENLCERVDELKRVRTRIFDVCLSEGVYNVRKRERNSGCEKERERIGSFEGIRSRNGSCLGSTFCRQSQDYVLIVAKVLNGPKVDSRNRLVDEKIIWQELKIRRPV